MRPVLALIATALAASLFSACGSEGIALSPGEPDYDGAVIFSQRCSGCHTLSAAGTEGSGNRALRPQGPNFDQRTETYADALFAIRNGGFSGAIMPQNIVVGDEAKAVARFVSNYAGSDVEEAPRPTPQGDSSAAGSESGTSTTTTATDATTTGGG